MKAIKQIYTFVGNFKCLCTYYMGKRTPKYAHICVRNF